MSEGLRDMKMSRKIQMKNNILVFTVIYFHAALMNAQDKDKRAVVDLEHAMEEKCAFRTNI